MKKLFTIASLFSFIFLFSQNEVAKKVKELENQKVNFKNYSVLISDSTPSSDVSQVVKNATFVKINSNAVNEIVDLKLEYISLSIPYNNTIVAVDLYKVNPFAEGFHVDTDKMKNISYEKGVYYRGIVKGNYTSVVAFNFFNNELNGIISSNELANVVVGKLDKVNNTSDYIVYSDANFQIANDFNCSLKDDTYQAVVDETSRDVNSVRCATIYFEIDYNLYQSNSSNTTTTTNWMTSVFNNVQTLYNNDGISTSLKSLYIWTTQDPYQNIGTSSADYLFKFNEVRPVFDGDLGQLVGIDPGGLGGVAVGINGLCTQNNFCYSDVNFSYSSVPTYSWTIEVVTHELGHLLGSPHTHACVWNNNNTSIDNCGPSSGTAEGSGCVTSPPTIPSSSVKGTIMSYCHLVSGVGISFSNGFGPQPSARIVSTVNASTCLSFDCINTCINFVDSISILSVTNTTVSGSFTDAGTATSWQRAINSFASNFPNWVTVTSNTFSGSGLVPNSYYKARVRPSCPSGVTGSSRDKIFATTANYCDGITITDTGGASGDYTDNQDFVRVISPNVAGQKITLTFSEFSLEADYDYLYVYDGNSTSATSFNVDGYTGTTVPGPFVSTASDGSLTMRFYADGGVIDSGWVASTSCSALLNTNEFDGIDFTYYPNPTNGMVSINSKSEINSVKVYNIAGQLLFDSQVNDLNTAVDISSFSTGTYFFKLKFDGEKEVNFKVLKM